ncbi:hypothetical protein KOW79_011669 [Hemibagrus wyckioides]|uniref:MI domain-containing protein n=1 Tax=Hemibagrus wyckioides TaxID=337641 RepID=A0A9D3SN11_9TELE|nr:hypothetical protein KOW79_011669 [Hemibagrus wyckioides]
MIHTTAENSQETLQKENTREGRDKVESRHATDPDKPAGQMDSATGRHVELKSLKDSDPKTSSSLLLLPHPCPPAGAKETHLMNAMKRCSTSLPPEDGPTSPKKRNLCTESLHRGIKTAPSTNPERTKGQKNEIEWNFINETNNADCIEKSDKELKVPTSDNSGATVSFHRLLLNRCQKEFEKDKGDDEIFQQKQKELDAATEEEVEQRLNEARRRSLGNIKFIGELFKLKMVKEQIMHVCIVKLLKNHEESLEVLCRLLSTIGKNLDLEESKPCMDQYFQQMEQIVKERKTSSRIRFMLQDVLDLRKNNWVPRRGDQGPKTIGQIHKDAELEEQRELIKVQQLLQSKKNSCQERRGKMNHPQDEGWNAVPNRTMKQPIDTPRLTEPDAGQSAMCTLNRFSVLHQSGPSSTSCSSSLDSKCRVPQDQVLDRKGICKPALSEEEVEKKTTAIIEEYLHINDLKEAVQCVEELNSASVLFVFVRNAVELTLERSAVARERLGLLLHELISTRILPPEQYFRGLREILEVADDMAIDIPHIWQYLTEIITPMLHDGGIPMGPLFRELTKPLLPIGKAAVLLVHILNRLGHNKAGALWIDAELNWKDFLPEDEDVNKFVAEQKMNFSKFLPSASTFRGVACAGGLLALASAGYWAYHRLKRRSGLPAADPQPAPGAVADVEEVEDVQLKVPTSDNSGATVSFHRLLLNRCQKEFEKDKGDDEIFQQKQKELDAATEEEVEQRLNEARRRSLGNIKFIGELFKLKMVKEQIMHVCIVKLLKNHEESLEVLCRLLSTIGKNLDLEESKPCMDQYFQQMEQIVKERKTSSRIRFMLQDVLDLRKNNWVPRRGDQGPKTIDQIHKDAELEEQRELIKVQQLLQSKKNSCQERRGKMNHPQDEGWNAVPNRTMKQPIDTPRLTEPDAGQSAMCTLNRFSVLHQSGPSSTSCSSSLDSKCRVPQDQGLDRKGICKPALSEEEVEKKTTAIIEEYLHINDLKEAVQCVEELNSASVLFVFVRNAVELTLERSTVARERLGLLLHELISTRILPPEQYFRGLREILEVADDMAIDIPHIWQYLTEIITPMLHDGGIPMGPLFRELTKPLLPIGKAAVLLVHILNRLGHNKAGALWIDAELNWKDFLPEDEDVNKFVAEQLNTALSTV